MLDKDVGDAQTKVASSKDEEPEEADYLSSGISPIVSAPMSPYHSELVLPIIAQSQSKSEWINDDVGDAYGMEASDDEDPVIVKIVSHREWIKQAEFEDDSDIEN